MTWALIDIPPAGGRYQHALRHRSDTIEIFAFRIIRLKHARCECSNVKQHHNVLQLRSKLN